MIVPIDSTDFGRYWFRVSDRLKKRNHSLILARNAATYLK